MRRTPPVPHHSVHRSRPGRRVVGRFMMRAAVLLVVPAVTASAQVPAHVRRGWEVVVPTGVLIPTGTQRASIQRGGMNAAQLFYVPRPSLAFTTTLGWARSRDVSSIDEPKLDVFSIDVGAEKRGPRWFADHRVSLMTFAGVGGGVRSYNYRSLHVDATHNLSAYASVGGELGAWRIRVRLEARDYLSGFQPLNGDGPTETRNDVVLMAGLRLVRR
jgi:hypothetical protein